MTGYRLYLLDHSGHIVDAIEFFRENDEQAWRFAEAHACGRPAELWSGARVVHSSFGVSEKHSNAPVAQRQG